MDVIHFDHDAEHGEHGFNLPRCAPAESTTSAPNLLPQLMNDPH